MNPIYPAEPKHDVYDVVIVGGAMYGSAISWFLTNDPAFTGRVLVLERDPNYEFASTTHTNSSIRQQYSQEINVRISQFGAQFLKSFREQMGGDTRVPPIHLDSFGYMYLASTPAFADALREVQQMQAACGAGTQHMTREQIAVAYPFYYLDDIIVGNHNTIDEGYFDGATMCEWFRRIARERGVEFVASEAVAMGLNAAGTKVETITLKSGTTVSCGQVVNASGPRALLTARMAGLDIPVEPRKRFTFIFDAEKPLDRPLPLTIDPSGVHMRSDGRYYMAGCPPDEDGPVDYTDFVHDHSIWEDKIWPALAHRVPQFEAIKVINSWVGHYAYNTKDQNAIVGRHPEVTNFVFCNGFSGHGLQQSPAVGRGVSELLIHGEYRTLDLTPFRYERFAEGDLLLEKAII
ncbi:NAD(P)/FAD-dependent oxidoreductase [Albibacillus kandeliae]|uniref:NAD(P)/FAD-dependent oxidoreductase n=1 Tax=Albibacillus kandeliae TaxID=2174228 RepID=UPI000D696830|nr:FAD-binding oxidoreductase [Albibacillus kandeliae]